MEIQYGCHFSEATQSVYPWPILSPMFVLLLVHLGLHLEGSYYISRAIVCEGRLGLGLWTPIAVQEHCLPCHVSSFLQILSKTLKKVCDGNCKHTHSNSLNAFEFHLKMNLALEGALESMFTMQIFRILKPLYYSSDKAPKPWLLSKAGPTLVSHHSYLTMREIIVVTRFLYGGM